MIESSVKTTIEGSKVIYKRYYDAPVRLLFEAWSQHKHLSEWWGPDGFTLTTISMDFSNGGIWDFIMHGPDGTEYKNRVHFIEILEQHSIVYKHLGDGGDSKDVSFHTIITLEDVGEGTNLTMEQEFPSKEDLERVDKRYGAIEGGKQHAENFAKYLATLKYKDFPLNHLG
jgi:uncharacterized protein YndB with AHSA1/START domain